MAIIFLSPANNAITRGDTMEDKRFTNMSALELEVFEQNLQGELDVKIRQMVQDERIREIYAELEAIEKEKQRRKENISG